MPSLVSVVVPNVNGAVCLKECLDSLLAQTYPAFEIWVVDNASQDESRKILKSFGSRLNVIWLERNKGFGTAINEAVARAKGLWIAPFNNDAEAEIGWLSALVKAAEKDEAIGMCASKIMAYDDRRIIDNVGHLLYWDGMNRGRGHGDLDLGQYDYENEALFPSGAAALYRRAMLDQIGGFDEDFFAYGDDAELGLRARLAGWECAFAPKAVVYHRGSATLGKFSVQKFFYVERNRAWVMLKYFPWPLIVLSPALSLWRYLLQGLAVIFRKGVTGEAAKGTSPWMLLATLYKAWFAALWKAPRMLTRRWRPWRKFSQKRRLIYKFLWKDGISAWSIAFRK